MPLEPRKELYKIRTAGVAIRQQASDVEQFTIEAGTYGVGATPVDLGAFYDLIHVLCPDASYIPATSYMYAYVSPSYPLYPMMVLYEQSDPGVVWAPSSHLPNSGGFDFLLAHAAGTRWLSFALDNPAAGDLDFYVYGLHRS